MLAVLITMVVAFVLAMLAKKFLTNPGETNPFEKGKPITQAKTPTTASAPKREGSKGAVAEHKPLILFASQTGTAEMFAKTLHREAARQGIDFHISDAEEYHPHSIPDEKLIIFVVATYGEGEPTDSAKGLHEYLMDTAREPDEFSGVKYCVFGLGDRQYPKFCQMAVDVDETMSKLGAKRIYGLGMGDAGRSLEEEWDTWRVDLWGAIAHALDIKLRLSGDEPAQPELTMKTFPEAKPAEYAFPRMSLGLEPTNRQPAFVKLAVNQELLKNTSDRSTRHIEFDISGTSLSYQAGDHLGVLPCNPDDVVEDYLKALGVGETEANTVFMLTDEKKKSVLPAKVSVRTALKWYVDLCGQPKKSALRAFTHYCTDPAEKAAFQQLLLVNAEAQEKYHVFIKEARTVLGILRKFKSCKIPLAHFLELMPRISPRYFSISSDQLRTPDRVFITVALVEGGLCTTMLSKMEVGAEQPVFVRKSTFHLPMNKKTKPLIWIGPGTGVAPLIGFGHRRSAWKARNQEIGKVLMFFGCRRRNEDFLYESLLNEWVSNGVITTLKVAFSREQAAKRYVQHDIQDCAAEVWEMLMAGANIYICGDAKHMAKDVEATLKGIFISHGGKTQKEADALLEKLTKDERYLKDVWSA
jgi:NADPH-ferrihemoprotein reductase